MNERMNNKWKCECFRINKINANSIWIPHRMQSVIYYKMHPFKNSVLYSMSFFLVAQCLSYISMVGLHIITFSLKWVMLKPVMLTVPLYWLQSDRATQQLFSAIPQILWVPKIHTVELFSLLPAFALLWS